MDLQAHGRTADIDRPMTYEAMADDVAALIEHLGVGEADVMGYSLGGGERNRGGTGQDARVPARHPARHDALRHLLSPRWRPPSRRSSTRPLRARDEQDS